MLKRFLRFSLKWIATCIYTASINYTTCVSVLSQGAMSTSDCVWRTQCLMIYMYYVIMLIDAIHMIYMFLVFAYLYWEYGYWSNPVQDDTDRCLMEILVKAVTLPFVIVLKVQQSNSDWLHNVNDGTYG